MIISNAAIFVSKSARYDVTFIYRVTLSVRKKTCINYSKQHKNGFNLERMQNRAIKMLKKYRGTGKQYKFLKSIVVKLYSVLLTSDFNAVPPLM